MRSKEEAHDYRYFPDPDLLPVILDPAWVEEIRASLPELPDQKKARLINEYGLSPYNASVIVAEKETADYFEQLCNELRKTNPAVFPRASVKLANWVIGDLFGALNSAGLKIEESPVTPESAAGLHRLIFEGTISGRIAKEVFEAMWETGKSAADIVEEKGLKQIDKEEKIAPIVDQLIADNPEQAEQFRAGNEKVLIADNPEQAEQFRAGNEKVIGWFVGQVMKATQGKANPGVVNRLLRDKLA
jgi:aspartyl-tRNA(Asn)/glutamyl-tRNA(Gln) amidotransferase subunit B